MELHSIKCIEHFYFIISDYFSFFFFFDLNFIDLNDKFYKGFYKYLYLFYTTKKI